MMGEFNSPGQLHTFKSELNLMEAIDMAGGISYTGNWRKVYIVRHIEDKKHAFYIDVTNKDLLGTDNYYLMPHDVVYIEPRPMGTARINITDFTLLLSTVTSTLTTILLIVTIGKL
jgi:polysaccharide export outer membrane protein